MVPLSKEGFIKFQYSLDLILIEYLKHTIWTLGLWQYGSIDPFELPSIPSQWINLSPKISRWFHSNQIQYQNLFDGE